MKVSTLRSSFFAQSPIDKDNMLPHRESYGWILSSPLTTIFSKMRLGSSPRYQQLEIHDKMSNHVIEPMTVASQNSSCDFPDDCSLSSYSSEEDSDAWLMEDIFEPARRDESYSNSHSSYDSSISQLEDEEHIWRMWDANEDIAYPEPLHYHVPTRQVPTHGHDTDRKLPSQIQQDNLESRKTIQLKRSSATRSPRRVTRVNRDPPSPESPRNKYSPFPPGTPTIPKLHQDYQNQCYPEPTPTKQRTRPQRLRANTTPAPTAPSIRKVSRPSNLSTCETLDPRSEYRTTEVSAPLFLQSAPVSPRFPCFEDGGLMDLMVETSYFSDDEDEEGENDIPAFGIAKMKSVWNLGRSGIDFEGEKLPVVVTKKKSRTRDLRHKLSKMSLGMFKNKGATL